MFLTFQDEGIDFPMIDLEAYYTQLKFDALRLWQDFIIYIASEAG